MIRGEGDRRGACLAIFIVCFALLPAAGADAQERGQRVPANAVAPRASATAERAPRGDALDRALRRGDVSRARHALARARSLFHLRRVRRRWGWVRDPAPQEATPILLRLSRRIDRLPRRARPAARAFLARPTDGASDEFGDGYSVPAARSCFTPAGAPRPLCVHWVRTTANAPPLTDGNANGRPDQVDRTISALDTVWNEQVGDMGYRAPLPDAGAARGEGPNTGTDIYLVDVGDDGLFGYCAADPRRGDRRLRAAAYCVIDDDFAPAQYDPPGPSGVPALQVTVAHEFFHAIQFAYEYSDRDPWLKEGTAVWIEDQVFDGVNASRSYLSESPLHQPEIPLDHAGLAADAQDFEYGAWVFWEFLAEYLGTDVIRQVMDATAPTAGSDPSALAALNSVVPGMASNPECIFCDPASFRRAFAEFALWNLFFDDPFFYDEGPAWFAALHGRFAPHDALFSMDTADYPATGERSVRLDGLAQGHVTFRVDPADAADNTLVVFSYGSGFEGGLEVTALVDPLGAGPLSAFDMTDEDSGVGFTDTEAVTLIYSNAAASPDGGRYEYEAFLEPDAP